MTLHDLLASDLVPREDGRVDEDLDAIWDKIIDEIPSTPTVEVDYSDIAYKNVDVAREFWVKR